MEKATVDVDFIRSTLPVAALDAEKNGKHRTPEVLNYHLGEFQATPDEVKKTPDQSGQFIRRSSIPHWKAYASIRRGLRRQGYVILGSSHGLARGGNWYAGLISVLPRFPKEMNRGRQLVGQYVPTVLIRNSYDNVFALSVHAGAHLYRAGVLWVSRKEAGHRRHTEGKKEGGISEKYVSEVMDRVDRLFARLARRFQAYLNYRIARIKTIHDLAFRAYDRGVLSKTQMVTGRERLIENEGQSSGTEQWRLFEAMQWLFSPRRQKSIFRYINLCGGYEKLLDELVGLKPEASISPEGRA